jgi:hypothetical protein
MTQGPAPEGAADGHIDTVEAARGEDVGDGGRTGEPKQRRRWWHCWGPVAAATGLVVVNALYFLISLNSYLEANEEGAHLIDTGMVSDRAMTTLWWQIVANGVLLMAFRRTRRTGLALLIAAALLFLFFLWVMLSIADQMG